MLLTSWVRSFRQSLQNFRQSSRRGRVAQTRALRSAPGQRSRMAERLEERTLLTALVFDSTSNVDFGIQVSNATLDPDNDGVANFERVVIDSVSFDGTGGRGVNINLSDLTGLQSIVIESLTISGTTGAGLDITLDNMSLEDGLVIESSSITSTIGSGIDLQLTDVELGTLTLFDNMVSSGNGFGVEIDVQSLSRNTVISGIDLTRNVADGVRITSDGATGTITGATNETQIQIRAIDHGLQTGSTVSIAGVTGNIAANTTDTIFIDPADPESVRENFFVLPNTDGSIGLLPSGEINGVYVDGGTWTLSTTLADISITENTFTDATSAGEEGVLVNLSNTDTPNFSISDNVLIKGIAVNLDNAPVTGLSIRNNQEINTTAIDGVGFTALNSDISGVRIEGNTIRGDGANGGNGISFDLTDSNFDGFVLNNTVVDTLGDGFLLTPTASDAFLATNGGPLTVSFTGDGINGNTFTNNPANSNAGAGFQFDLEQNTTLAGNFTNNTVTGFQQGGLDIAVDDTDDALNFTVTDNRFDQISGRSIAVVLEDAATGQVDISRNTITRGVNIPSGDNGDGIHVRLVGIDLLREATSILQRSTISDNIIGTPGGGRVAVPMSAASSSLIVDDISGFTTTLTREISTTDTMLTVADIVRLPPTPNFNIRVGNEIMTVTAISGSTVTVTRGVSGTIAAEHDEGDVATPLDFEVLVDGERMTVINVVNNTLQLAQRLNEDVALGPNDPLSNNGFFDPGEDTNTDGVFNRPVIHDPGAPIIVGHGGNAGAGVVVFLEEETEIQDLLIDANFVGNNRDDGIKFERDDNGRVSVVNPREGQRRAVTISNNAIMGNAEFATDDINAGAGGAVPFGAGIDIIARNSSIDSLDFEIRGNTVAGNIGAEGANLPGVPGEQTAGISIRAEADANILADIVANHILFNTGTGITASTRLNDPSDQRDVGGTWIANEISHNGEDGIELIGSFGISPLQPVVIGLEGVDLISGLSRGNIIEDNGDDGIDLLGPVFNELGNVSITNNTISRSGRNGSVAPDIANAGVINGAGIDLRERVNVAIKNNTLIENAGIGIDLNATSIATASIRGNLITGSGNDGIELTSGIRATLLGNSIDSNFGRGIDILNSGGATANVKIGDGTEPGRNLIVGNRLEGVYLVHSAGGQDQNAPLGVLAATGGRGSASAPRTNFQLDTNTIEDNGRDSLASATGVIFRVGSTQGGSQGAARDGYSVRPGTPEGVGDIDFAASNSRVNARVVNNTFQGNFGDDFDVRSFRSTTDPLNTPGSWDIAVDPVYNLQPGYERDPLARLNLVFDGNSGNSLGALGAGGGSYTNSEPIWKSRLSNFAADAGPDGPFGPPPGPNRERSIQRVASRSFQIPFGPLSIPNTAPSSFGQVSAATSGEGIEPVTITTPNHGLSAGITVEITGARSTDPRGIHSANGTFIIGIPTDPGTGLPDPSRFFLVGTEGSNSSDHVPGTGRWVFNNPQPGVNLNPQPFNSNPEFLSFLYDGTGPSTFRIAQGFDSSGTQLTDEFGTGSNFTGGTWVVWAPQVDLNNPTNGSVNSFVDPAVSTFPIAEFIPVTPDPRRVNAGTVTLNFTEPVSGVDIHDFRLTLDGFPLDISTIPVQQVTSSQYTINLSSVTQLDGTYDLILDNQAPTASIRQVSPDPRFSDAGTVTIEFTEAVTGVDIYDFALQFDPLDGSEFAAIDLSETGVNLAVQQISPSVYTIDLSSFTDPVGAYRLQLLDRFNSIIRSRAGGNGTGPVILESVNHGLSNGQEISVLVAGVPTIFEITLQIDPGTNRPSTDFLALNGSDNLNPLQIVGTIPIIGQPFDAFEFDPDIIDGIGLELGDDEVEVWNRANTVPTAQIVPISLDPRDSGVNEGFNGPGTGNGVRVIFNEPVRTSTVGIDDFTLTRDIGLNPFMVNLAGATVVPDPNFTSTVAISGTPTEVATQFIITGLQSRTQDFGRYRLTLEVAGGTTIRDVSNSSLAFPDFDEWDVIVAGPSPNVSVFEPGVAANSDRRIGTYNTSIRSIQLTFDEPVIGGLTPADFVLVRTDTDGTVTQLDVSATIVTDLTGIGTSFRLSNLEAVTEDASNTPIDGTYNFTLSHVNDANGASPITNLGGEALAVSAEVVWITDATVPTANIFNTENAPDDRDFNPITRIDDDAGFVTVQFAERVTGINRFSAATDFTLELDRQDGNGFIDITNEFLIQGVRVLPLDPTFRDGIVARPFDTFQNDPVLGTVLAEVFASRYVLDMRNVANAVGNDGIYRLTLDGSIVDPTGNEFAAGPDPDPSDLFTPPPVVETWTQIPLPANLPSTIFDAEFPFRFGGERNVLQLEATERFVVDATPPEVVAGTVNVAPDPRNSAVGIVTVNFTEDVEGVDINDFELELDGVDVPLNDLVVVQVSPTSYTIDLNLVTGASGIYEFFLDGQGSLIRDAALNDVSQTLALLDTWTTDITSPGATFENITSPRMDVPDTVLLTFDEPVEVADIQIEDFSLQRDTGSGFGINILPTSGATVTAQNESNGLATIFAVDLSVVADDEAIYRLVLDSDFSNITDDADNVLAIGASVLWDLDLTPPIVDIIDITPDPRSTAVGLVNIIFQDSATNNREGVLGFGLEDLRLTRDTVNVVDLTGLTLTQQTASRFTIDLSAVTATNGDYVLTILTDSITDLAGNLLAQNPNDVGGLAAGEAARDAWTTGPDSTPPTVLPIDVAPNPANELNSNAGVVSVDLSEDVSGVDFDDFRLFRNGSQIVLTASNVDVSPVPGTAARYTIDLTAVTEVAGAYELQVIVDDPTLEDIRDRSGNALREVVVGTGVAASDTWDRILQPPTATIVDTLTGNPVLSPRLRAIQNLDVTFSEAVTGVDVDPGATDFQLTRDADPNDSIPGQFVSLAGVTVEQLTTSLYRFNLAGVTGVDGFYELTLTTNGNIQSLASPDDKFVTSATISFTVDTTIDVNRFTDTDDATPGNGTAADSTGLVSLRAAIMEANALPGPDTIILGPGTYILNDIGAGEDFAFSGDLDIRDDLTIVGDGASTTIIDAAFPGTTPLGERIFQIFAGVRFDLSGVTLTGGSVTGSEDGGAIRSAGTVTVSDAVIVNNTSEDDGGAINNSGTMTIQRTTIAANSADSSGGAIRNSGTLTVSASTIGGPNDGTTDLRNTSRLEGGGLINISGGVATIIDTTISGNVANIDVFGTGGLGGAISNRATLVLQNATITNNSADVEAGGVFSSSTASATVRNTIIAANMAAVREPDISGTFASAGNNFIGDPGTTTAFVDAVNNDQVGVAGTPINPQIGPLADNGGPTLTQALLLGSPAIDTGSNVSLVSTDTDQRGSTRILDGDGDATPVVDAARATVDIGAFEFGGLFVNDPRDLPDPNPGDGVLDIDPFTPGVQITLRSAIMEANALPGQNTILVPAGDFLLDRAGEDVTGPSVETFTLDVSAAGVGTASLRFSEQVTGVDVSDFTLNEVRDITSVSNDGVGPIIITTTSTQGLVTGDTVTVSGVLGNAAANGTFAITLLSTTTFALNGTVGNGDFLGGGQWARTTTNLGAAGVTVTQTSQTEYTIDLSALTQPNAQYTLILTAAGSAIQDLSGNALASDAVVTATRGVDSFSPSSVDIVDIQPDPRNTTVGLVTVNFQESVTGVVNTAFSLTQSRQITGTSGDATSPITITTSSTAGLVNGETVTITNVTTGNPAANGTFTITVVDATTFQLNGTTGNGASPSDGEWTRNLDLSTAVVAGFGTSFTIELTGVTGTAGDYTLTLDPALSPIQDTAGNALLVSAVDSWTIIDSSPDADIIDITPDPRIDSAGIVTIQFNEDVTGVDISDFTLTRDIGSGPVSVNITGLTVNPLAGGTSQFTIDLTTVSAIDGTYTLTLTAPGSQIQDLVGNPLLGTASDTWTVGENQALIGDLDVTDTTGRLRIIGAGATLTTINGGNLDRVFEVVDGVRLELADLAVTGGRVVGGGDGGGILNSGELQVSGGAVTGNVTDGDGGGIHNDTMGTAELVGTVISGNMGRFGGGIFTADDSTLIIGNDSIISGNTAVVDGGGVFSDRRTTATIENSSVRSNTAGRDGGGYYNNDVANLTAEDSIFEGNVAARDGGGIFNEQAAVLTMTSSTISANRAANGAGLFNDDGVATIDTSIISLNQSSVDAGAIFNQSQGNIAVTETSFSGNRAVGDGGAIQNFGTFSLMTSSLTLNNAADQGGAIQNFSTLDLLTTSVRNNSAREGGGIDNSGSGRLTVTTSTIERNTAAFRGGGLLNSEAARAAIDDTTLTRNAAGTDGGAIYHDSSDTVSVTRSTLAANTAGDDGAGINNQQVMTVVNSTISTNTAEGAGGGLYNNGSLTVTHSTIYQNSAGGRDNDGDMTADDFGGGVFNNAPFAPLRVLNTIIAGNMAGSDPDIGGNNFTSIGFNLIGDSGSTLGFLDSINGDLFGSTTTGIIDPQLGVLSDNGGRTQTHALLFGSPARDTGTNLNPPSTDQRGFSRIVDGDGNGIATIDIGSFESGFVVTSFADSVDVFPGDRVSADKDGFSTLRASVIEANALVGDNTIILGAGRFELSIPGVDEGSSLTGDLDITDDLAIIGAGPSATIIDGNALDRIFDVRPGITLRISNLTVLGGRAVDGGGIRNLGTLEMDNVAIRSNTADFGGGVFTGTTLATLEVPVALAETVLRLLDGSILPQLTPFEITIDEEELRVTSISGDDVTVVRAINGTTVANHGVNADVVLRGVTRITDSVIGGRVNESQGADEGNTANVQGGGLYNKGVLNVTDSQVSGNQANAQGGGLFNTGVAEITTTTIGGINAGGDRFGNVSDSRGGGVYNIHRFGRLTALIDSVVTTISLDSVRNFPSTPSFEIRVGSEEMVVTQVVGTTFIVVRGSNGTQTDHSTGEVVSLIDKSRVTIDRTTVSGNLSSSNGAGVYNGDQLFVTTSTFSGNQSGGRGGAIDSVAFASIRNTTVTANSADTRAGGVANSGTNEVRVRSTIIAFNIAGASTDPDNDVQGVFRSVGTNLIGDSGTSVGFVNGVNGDQVGAAASPFDPVLGPLASNGGPTLTHTPLSGSPAINNSDNTGGPNIDQRGEPRPADASADIGAVEQGAVIISINDIMVAEGDTGQTDFEFTLRLSRPTVQPISVEFVTLPGLVIVDPATGGNLTTPALNGDDFLFDSGRITFTPGELVATVTVLVNADTIIEPNEIFSVAFSNPLNAILGNSEATATILNDDTSVKIDDVSLPEADSGITQFSFTVELTEPTVETISVNFTTANGAGATGATAGSDYAATSDTLVFLPGEQSKPVLVEVNGDVTPEQFESFEVNLTVTGGTAAVEDGQGIGTIQNDDIQLVLSGGGNTSESNSPLPFTVTMVAADGSTAVQNAFDVTVDLITIEGTATGGSDFTALSGSFKTVTISAGATSAPLPITIIDDSVFEGGATGTPETFSVAFDTGTVTRGGVAYAEVATTLGPALAGSITDNELPPTVWVVRRTSAGTQGEILRDGTDDGVFNPIFLRNYALNAQVAVDQDPGDRNDRFIIDFVNGNPIPTVPDGIIIDGGDQTSGDSLEIQDLSSTFTFNSVVYTATGAKSGTIAIDDGAGQSGSIRYLDLEPVLDIVPAVARAFTIDSASLSGNREILVANAGGLTVIRDDDSVPGNAFETITFANPTSTLTVNAGNANDRVTVQDLSAVFATAPPTLIINAGGGDDIIDASAFNAGLTINGDDGNDVVTGSAFGDSITGGLGTDNITAGAGNDIIQGGDGDDTIDAGAGADNANGDGGEDSITGGTENDTLSGGAGDDVITGDAGNDDITGGDDNDNVTGGDGNDQIDGQAGNDTVSGEAGQDTVDGGGDADTVSGGADNDTVRGGAGDDIVTGDDGNDSLDGGDDNDTLDGGLGVDAINGGNGADQLSGSVTGSQNATLTNTTFNVGGLIDTFDFVEQVIIIGGDGSNRLDASAYTIGSVTIDGGDGNDTMLGSSGSDSLNGGLGDDSIDAGAGNDTALGGGGRDIINGGDGNDTLGGNSGNDLVTGGGGFDSVAGGDGDDTLSGGESNDTLDGDLGNDILMGDAGNDRLVGDAGADMLFGGDGVDRLFGSSGNDTLSGGSGRDTVNGGAGRDSLSGDGDKDRLLGGAGRDILVTDGSGVDTLNGQGSGLDSVVFTGTPEDDSYLIENLGNRYRILDLTGRTDRVVVTRTERVFFDLLDGDDSVLVEDLNTILGVGIFNLTLGAGNDTVNAVANTNSNFSFVVNGGAGDDTIETGAGADNVTAGDGNDSVTTGAGDDTINGGQGSDTLNGMSGADVIDGGTEADTILGGSEADSLTGGDGNDTIRGNGGEDTISGGRGRDLLFGDEAADNIFGDDDADSIAGGGGNDNIQGGDGNDVIKGEDGEDFIEGGNGNDTISGGLKNDRINGQDGQDKLLGGADNDTLTGGAREDLLVGGRGADSISGQGTNRDTLVGETGLDGTDDDAPDPGDTFDNANEINNAFVVPQAIFDLLDSFN